MTVEPIPAADCATCGKPIRPATNGRPRITHPGKCWRTYESKRERERYQTKRRAPATAAVNAAIESIRVLSHALYGHLSPRVAARRERHLNAIVEVLEDIDVAAEMAEPATAPRPVAAPRDARCRPATGR